MSYRFGKFDLEVEERRLFRDGEPVSLTPKVFDTLVYLVERHGHLVEKDELLDAVWGGSYVEEGNLPRTIHILRKALGNGDNGNNYIETVPTKGYRFIAEVTRVDTPAIGAEPPDALEQEEAVLEAPTPRPNRHRRAFAIGGVALLVLAASGWLATHHRSGSNKPGRLITASGAAYTKYQTGRVYMERQHRRDTTQALENFEAAIRLDPQFAAAYAGKADAKIYQFWGSESHDDIVQARLAVTKAIELDPNNSYAHTLLCRILATYDWDFAGAEDECRRAIALDARNHEARRELAFLLNSIGRKDEALKEMDVAVELAPTSFNKRSRGLLLYFDRRYDEAIAQFKQVEASDPDYSESSRWIARCLEQTKDYRQALKFLIRYREAAGANSDEVTELRRAFASGGWQEVLRTSLRKGQFKATLETAGTLAELGEKDEAIQVLENMIRDRRVMIVHMDSDPRLDPVRSDPRYEQLARRVGLR